MGSWVDHLSPHLFWDVDQETVDPDKHARWILERVLERGRWEDWLLVREHYDKSELRTLAPRLRVGRKALGFLGLYCRDD